ncbi:hypothetical protein FHR51_000647 [Xanthomonas arboricola]|uniref:hypothetical protein n=1 Tax=Xanthomonas cannabis TaxID=1885674 RepID=UPI00160BE69F|nr:hypothetical protein [Xanthomonas cannabis]MBB3804536.1 hypothetical protein [Xanthomonas cannabis]
MAKPMANARAGIAPHNHEANAPLMSRLHKLVRISHRYRRPPPAARRLRKLQHIHSTRTSEPQPCRQCWAW